MICLNIKDGETMKALIRRSLFLMAGVVLMSNLFGCSRIKFEKYTGRDEQLNVSMDYIAGWAYRESRGSNNSYAEVVFLPKEKRNNWTMIVLVVKESSKVGAQALDPDGAADDIIGKRMKFKDAQVLSRSKINALGTAATMIELSYLTLEDLRERNNKLIPVKEEIIVLSKGDKFYFLRYMNSAKEFNKYKAAFMHIAQSMQIK